MKGSDSKKIYQAVFDGVLSNLDIYSRYAGIEEARKNRAKRQGFGGIGIRLRVDEGVVRVTQVMPKTPAEIAGLIKGDIITHIGQISTATMKNRRRRSRIARRAGNARRAYRRQEGPSRAPSDRY